MNLALDARSIISIVINANLDTSNIKKDAFKNAQKSIFMTIQLKLVENVIVTVKYVQDPANVQLVFIRI